MYVCMYVWVIIVSKEEFCHMKECMYEFTHMGTGGCMLWMYVCIVCMYCMYVVGMYACMYVMYVCSTDV